MADSGSGDWREGTLNTIRQLINDADPDVVEEAKWVKPSNSASAIAHGSPLRMQAM